jgi:hypothetical protein
MVQAVELYLVENVDKVSLFNENQRLQNVFKNKLGTRILLALQSGQGWAQVEPHRKVAICWGCAVKRGLVRL